MKYKKFYLMARLEKQLRVPTKVSHIGSGEVIPLVQKVVSIL